MTWITENLRRRLMISCSLKVFSAWVHVQAQRIPFQISSMMAFLPQNPLSVFLFCFFTPPWMCHEGSDCQAYRAFKTHFLFFNSHCRVSVLIDRRISSLPFGHYEASRAWSTHVGSAGFSVYGRFLCFLFLWTLLKALSSKHAHCTPKNSPFSKHKSNNKHIAKLLLRAFA